MESTRTIKTDFLAFESTEIDKFDCIAADLLMRNGNCSPTASLERKGDSEGCRNNNPSCRKARETVRHADGTEQSVRRSPRSRCNTRSENESASIGGSFAQNTKRIGLDERQSALHSLHSDSNSWANGDTDDGISPLIDTHSSSTSSSKRNNGTKSATERSQTDGTNGIVVIRPAMAMSANDAANILASLSTDSAASIHNDAAHRNQLPDKSGDAKVQHSESNSATSLDQSSILPMDCSNAHDTVDAAAICHVTSPPRAALEVDVGMENKVSSNQLVGQLGPSSPDALTELERRVSQQSAHCARLRTCLRTAQLQLVCNHIASQLAWLQDVATASTSQQSEAAVKPEVAPVQPELPCPSVVASMNAANKPTTSMRTRSCGAVSPIFKTQRARNASAQKTKTPNSVAIYVRDTINHLRTRAATAASNNVSSTVTTTTPIAASNVSAAEVRAFAMRTDQFVRNLARSCDPDLTESSSDDEDDADYDDVDWAAQALARVPACLAAPASETSQSQPVPSAVEADQSVANTDGPLPSSLATEGKQVRPDASTSCWPYSFVETRVSIERRLDTKLNWHRRRAALVSRARWIHALKLDELDQQLRDSLSYYSRLRGELHQHESTCELDDPEAPTYLSSRYRPFKPTRTESNLRRLFTIPRDYVSNVDDEAVTKPSRRVANRLARLSHDTFHSRLSCMEDAPRSLLRAREVPAFERAARVAFELGTPEASGALRRINKQTVRNATLVQQRLEALSATTKDNSSSPRRRRQQAQTLGVLSSKVKARIEALSTSKVVTPDDSLGLDQSADVVPKSSVGRKRKPKRRTSEDESPSFSMDIVSKRFNADAATGAESATEEQPPPGRARRRESTKSVSKRQLQPRVSAAGPRWRKKRRDDDFDWCSDLEISDLEDERHTKAGSGPSSGVSRDPSPEPNAAIEEPSGKVGDRSRSQSDAREQSGVERRKSASTRNKRRSTVVEETAQLPVTATKSTSYDHLRSSLMKTQDYLVDYSIGAALFTHVHVEPEARLDIPTPSWRTLNEAPDANADVDAHTDAEAPAVAVAAAEVFTVAPMTPIEGETAALVLEPEEALELSNMHDEAYRERHGRAENQERLRYESILQRHSTQRRSRMAASADKVPVNVASETAQATAVERPKNGSSSSEPKPVENGEDDKVEAENSQQNHGSERVRHDSQIAPAVVSEDADAADASSQTNAITTEAAVRTAEAGESAAPAATKQPSAIRRRFTRVRTVEYVRSNDSGWPARVFPLTDEELQEMTVQDDEARDIERMESKQWRAIAERLAELRRSMRCGTSLRRSRPSNSVSLSHAVHLNDLHSSRSRNDLEAQRDTDAECDTAPSVVTDASRPSETRRSSLDRQRIGRPRVVLRAHRRGSRTARYSLQNNQDQSGISCDEATRTAVGDATESAVTGESPGCVMRQSRTRRRGRVAREKSSLCSANDSPRLDGTALNMSHIRPRIRPTNMPANSMRVHPSNVLRLSSEERRQRREKLVRRSVESTEQVLTQFFSENSSAKTLIYDGLESNCRSAVDICRMDAEHIGVSKTVDDSIDEREREKMGLVLRLKVRRSTTVNDVAGVSACLTDADLTNVGQLERGLDDQLSADAAAGV